MPAPLIIAALVVCAVALVAFGHDPARHRRINQIRAKENSQRMENRI